jgi:hypothetical protein
MRVVKIFCAAFTIFFVIGFYTGRKERKAMSEPDFVIDVAAQRFTRSHDRKDPLLYYACGDKVLYSYSLDRNALQQVSYHPTLVQNSAAGLSPAG